MKAVFYILAGLAGGVLAGMGMGGGTLTLPILVLALGVPQLTAQYANLLAFLPSGTGALVLHAKSGLLHLDGILVMLIPAIVSSALAAYAATYLDGALLRKLFGGFLTAVALGSLFAKTFKKS